MRRIFTKFSAFNALIWTACLALLVAIIAAVYVIFGSIDVLKNWRTSVGGDGKTFVAGQVLYFESRSEKLISVPGTADRQLICDAKGQYIEREITIDSIDLKRPAGVNPLRKNALTLPNSEAFKDQQGAQTLPRVCRVRFNACYKVYNFRDHCEESETQKFIVTEVAPEGVETDNSADVEDTIQPNAPVRMPISSTPVAPTAPSATSSQSSTTTTTPQGSTTTNSTTESTTTNNNTTIEAPQPQCLVDTNLLGLIPIKLICQ